MKVKGLFSVILLISCGLIIATVIQGLHFIKEMNSGKGIQIAKEIEAAYAQNTPKSSDKKAHTSKSNSGTDPAKNPAVDKQAPAGIPDKTNTSSYIKYLEKKEKELEMREKALKEKEALLKELEKDINAKLAKLEEIQKGIEEFKKQQAQLANQKIDSIVKIYTTMKPKDAAALLEKLDDDLVVEIVSRMKTEQAAKIIASMSVKKAAVISEKLTKTQKPPFP